MSRANSAWSVAARIALVTVLVSTACSVLIGEPDPHTLSADAGSPATDARPRLDGSVADAKGGDRTTIDAPPGDVTLAPETSIDGRAGDALAHDALAHDALAHDALAHDALAHDASDARRLEASASKAGFCASFFLEAGATTGSITCEDFDEDPDAAEFSVANGGSPLGTGNGEVTVQDDASLSSPSALRVTAIPSDAGLYRAYLYRTLAPGGSFMVQFDVLVEQLDYNSRDPGVSFVTLSFSSGWTLRIGMRAAVDSGPPTLNLTVVTPGGDSGPDQVRPDLPAAVLARGWNRINLSADMSRGGALVCNGTPLAGGVELPFPLSNPSIDVGFEVVHSSGVRRAVIDNVLVVTGP